MDSDTFCKTHSYLSIAFEAVDIIALAALLTDEEIDVEVVVSLVVPRDEIQYRNTMYTRQAEIAARVAMDFGPITDDSCSTCVRASVPVKMQMQQRKKVH